MATIIAIPKAPKAIPHPSTQYLLERDIQDHMQKRVLIGAEPHIDRQHLPLSTHYKDAGFINMGRVVKVEPWETMSYDSWISRFGAMMRNRYGATRIA